MAYTKAVRFGNFANSRRALKFLPAEFDKSDITDKILFHKAEAFQSRDGLRVNKSAVKIYGDAALFDGKFSEFFGKRVFVKRAENGYEILYTDKIQRGFIKSKFTLENGESGRIVYNDRLGGGECPWIYFLVTWNFVCADKESFKPKIFYIKQPDFVFKDLKPLRYSGQR